MGHLLASVNPDAAGAIQEPLARPRLPDVGELVIYHMRMGYARDGKTRFPALVQGHGERDTLALTVIIDAAEFTNETLVTEIQVGNQFHCWERVSGAGVRPLAERLDEPAGLRGIVAANERALADLRQVVLGDYDEPKISIIAIMVDFENRLRSIGEKVDRALDLIGAAVGEGPAVVPRKPRAVPAKGRKPAKKAAKRGK